VTALDGRRDALILFFERDPVAFDGQTSHRLIGSKVPWMNACLLALCANFDILGLF
jgi:hypothetical protein